MSSSNIKLIVTFQDGRYQTITISDKKPIGAVFEKLVELEGRPIYSLYKNGVEIPKKGEMIKYVPLKNGDKLTEGGPKLTSSGLQNLSMHSFQNSILRKKVEKGEISRENVVELQFIPPNIYKPVNVMVMKDSSVDDLKVSLSELQRRHIFEIAFFGGEERNPLGWTGDMKNDSRSYNGKQKIDDLGVVNGTILKEIYLPKTTQELKKEAEAAEKRVREWQEAAKRAAERQKEAWKRQVQEEERAFQEEQARRAKQEEQREKERARDYFSSQRSFPGTSSSSSSHPQTTATTKKSCEQMLREAGITSKSGFKKWALEGHHTNKGGNLKTFQEISNCNDEMKRLYGDNWDLSKRGGRRKSRTARIKRSVRKHRGTHKKKSHT